MLKIDLQLNRYFVVVSIILFASLFFSSSDNLYAKGKQMERIKTMKKIRLLEVLELDANTSDKFLIKYNEYETKIEKKMEEIRTNLKELKNILDESNKSNPIIKDKVNLLNKLQTELHNTISERDKDMKSILDEFTYAKYLVFEMGFKDKVVEKMMEMRGKNDEQPNGDKNHGDKPRNKEKRKGWD